MGSFISAALKELNQYWLLSLFCFVLFTVVSALFHTQYCFKSTADLVVQIINYCWFLAFIVLEY